MSEELTNNGQPFTKSDVMDSLDHYIRFSTKTNNFSDLGFYERVKILLSVDDWISVDERLPEDDGKYLCQFSDGIIETFDYKESEYKMWGVYNVIVTHWETLPAPPKEKG